MPQFLERVAALLDGLALLAVCIATVAVVWAMAVRSMGGAEGVNTLGLVAAAFALATGFARLLRWRASRARAQGEGSRPPA